ncbi:MAG: twin transmembrane helix small protein [Pseudomonadota bacterium]
MGSQVLVTVALIACLIVGAVLIWGVTLFGTGSDPKKSNKVMQLRIMAQFAAVIVIVLVALALNGAS